MFYFFALALAAAALLVIGYLSRVATVFEKMVQYERSCGRKTHWALILLYSLVLVGLMYEGADIRIPQVNPAKK